MAGRKFRGKISAFTSHERERFRAMANNPGLSNDVKVKGLLRKKLGISSSESAPMNTVERSIEDLKQSGFSTGLERSEDS